jgi:AraC family transcriptional regulator
MSVLHRFEGATVRRVIDRSHAVVAEHSHDWPMLSLFVMGSYRNVTERCEQDIAGPSLVFYGRGEAHQNLVGDVGFEQIEIEFDPAWVGRSMVPVEPFLFRIGGASGALAHALAIECALKLSAPQLREKVNQLFSTARKEDARPTRAWVTTVTAELSVDPRRRIDDLANEVALSPAWIGPAYRRWAGEGLQEAAARFRVERASRMLRESDLGLATIAAEVGFCDQSHMNRVFRRVLGRAPTVIRRERDAFRHGGDTLASSHGSYRQT